MFAEELRFTFDLSFPHPKCRDNAGRRGSEGTVRGSRRGDSTPDAESRHLTHPKHCPYTESDVLRIEQTELRHF